MTPIWQRALGAAALSQRSFEMWAQFEALGKYPTLVLRGEHSDILNEDTLAQMRQRHKDLEVEIVAGQGHAPLLRDEKTNDRITEFLGGTKRAEELEEPEQAAAR